MLLAHLHFFNAFSLLYRRRIGDGELSEEEGRRVLAWRASDSAPAPEDPRTRRIADMVHPGARNPSSPIHAFVSEIFDRDDPPLYKNFLRVDTTAAGVTITCLHATGEEQGPQDVRGEEPIEIPLPPGES